MAMFKSLCSGIFTGQSDSECPPDMTPDSCLSNYGFEHSCNSFKEDGGTDYGADNSNSTSCDS